MNGLLHKTVLAGLVGCRSTEMSLQVVEEIVSNVGVIEKLANFQHKDANGKDWGLNVRQRAKELVALVTDTERVRSERAKVWSCCHDPFSAHEMAEVSMNAGSHEAMHPWEYHICCCRIPVLLSLLVRCAVEVSSTCKAQDSIAGQDKCIQIHWSVLR